MFRRPAHGDIACVWCVQAVIQEIDDLDAEKSPEDLMLSYVSDKSNKDRADRELVAPWFKFLWETYRNILEILRNNVKFTQMYGMVTKQAFQFCLQYKRNTEFRRLCEILRNQLLTLRKYVRASAEHADHICNMSQLLRAKTAVFAVRPAGCSVVHQGIMWRKTRLCLL